MSAENSTNTQAAAAPAAEGVATVRGALGLASASLEGKVALVTGSG